MTTAPSDERVSDILSDANIRMAIRLADKLISGGFQEPDEDLAILSKAAIQMHDTLQEIADQDRTKSDIIEAQSKALAEARVARPLEWTKIDNANDDESEEAVTPFGGYVITADPFTYSPTTAYYVDGPDWFKAQCASVPEAKAAAQSDYETRVRSATCLHQIPRLTSEDDAPTESILHALADREKSADDIMDQAREKRRHAAALITDAEMLEQLAYDTADYCGGGEP